MSPAFDSCGIMNMSSQVSMFTGQSPKAFLKAPPFYDTIKLFIGRIMERSTDHGNLFKHRRRIFDVQK